MVIVSRWNQSLNTPLSLATIVKQLSIYIYLLQYIYIDKLKKNIIYILPH